jgi:AraC family transcriptional regulator
MRNRIRSGGMALEPVSVSNGEASTAPALPFYPQRSGVVLPMVREKRLQRVLQRLESELPRSVRELAAEVHLSPAHLQRLFKQETGVHISDLLCERRLTMAADLLTTTRMSVKEVAYIAGYGHHSSFVRAFERRFGQSPRLYRQRGA